ncbi:hypothetical protein D1007_40736 [Hordeum vulgare]|nr:hypothetical protein D1007_40736 [Hordeum vulgare]
MMYYCCYAKWLCCAFLFMLTSYSYALSFHYVILLWLISSLFKLNLTLIRLEQICWLSHSATQSSSRVQPHVRGWEALMRYIVMPLVGASNEGRLSMHATLIR